jgi:hypothetical protein
MWRAHPSTSAPKFDAANGAGTRRTSRPGLSALAAVLWGALLGCGIEGDPCVALVAASEPHRAGFARFAAVAERVAGADSAFERRAQLEEGLFVSLRGEPTVLAAWIERIGAAPLTVTLPSVAPAIPVTFSRCRAADGERFEVARGELQIGETPGPAVFLRRTITLGAPQTLVVTVAYLDEAR